MPSIHVTLKDGGIYDYPILKEEITIGRGKENDIVLKDSTISRAHAKIIKSRNDYRIIDLGSFNGTLVNGKSIQNEMLNDRDQIKIGLTKLVFSLKNQDSFAYANSQVLFSEANDESDSERIVKSRPLGDFKQPEELLVKDISRISSSVASGEDAHDLITKEGVSTLERSNKVLFILYEISKQLNSIGDFDELLNKIMDLIFMVIDADYGFLILTGERGMDNLMPVVVKVQNDKIRKKGELKASKTIVNKVIHDKVSLMTSNAMMDSRLDHGKSLFLHQVRSAMCVPLWKKDTIIGVIQLGSIRMDNHFNQDDLQLLQTIGSQMAMVIEQASLNEHIREEERLRNRLERFHSPQVIEMILKSGQDTKDNIMEPKDLTATILFADIIGFTRLSEKMPPREINMILNRFFSRMTDIIFEFGGTLDKYIGDALMAVFGAPMEKEGDAERATLAALKMRRELAVMMDSTAAESRFDVRIGINTGRVVAGNMGSPRRMDYTVIGDPVNIAQRLESIAQPNQILIGQETYNFVRDKFRIEKVGERHVKGRAKEIIAYEVIG